MAVLKFLTVLIIFQAIVNSVVGSTSTQMAWSSPLDTWPTMDATATGTSVNCYSIYSGDGLCDDSNNIPECNYDEG